MKTLKGSPISSRGRLGDSRVSRFERIFAKLKLTIKHLNQGAQNTVVKLAHIARDATFYYKFNNSALLKLQILTFCCETELTLKPH